MHSQLLNVLQLHRSNLVADLHEHRGNVFLHSEDGSECDPQSRDPWSKSLIEFVYRAVRPNIPSGTLNMTDRELVRLVATTAAKFAIDDASKGVPVARVYVSNTTTHSKASAGGVNDMSGGAFEEYCAVRLRMIGWEVQTTKQSGDQGVDLIAIKNKRRVAIQCKRYSTPVGNAAVQEIFAGKSFAFCEIGVVVTNSTFTPSARTLAASTNVLLMHYAELDGFNRLLG